MVVALGPGKFYGSSLPRPRIYTDVKNNDERVDPPVPVLDPFLSWAREAHWSMGGLNVKRHRLQGRIEGSIKKLRAERESFFKKSIQVYNDQIAPKSGKDSAPRGGTRRNASPSPPPAPVAVKRRRYLGLVDEDEDGDERESEGGNEGKENGGVRIRRRPARKLWDDFDRVASENNKVSPVKGSSGGSETVASRTRGRRSEESGGYGAETVKVVEEVNGSNSKRTSPRLVKRRLS